MSLTKTDVEHYRKWCGGLSDKQLGEEWKKVFSKRKEIYLLEKTVEKSGDKVAYAELMNLKKDVEIRFVIVDRAVIVRQELAKRLGELKKA